jgi:hypothetical protein
MVRRHAYVRREGLHLRCFGRLVFYRAFIEGELEVPRQLARNVHDLHFNPPARGIRAPDDAEPFKRFDVFI